MKVHAILNRDGGTLRTTDLDALKTLIVDEFGFQGHVIDVEIVGSVDVGEAIAAQAARTDLDVLLVGGGDGTVSGAAGAVAKGPIALALLPAGTMNLFARSLQIPLDLPEAVRALASGHIVEVDIASVNDRYFVHQFAVGVHARMVRTRETFDYGSRLGKMWASVKAIGAAVRSLPLIDLEIEIDGQRESLRSPAVAISNNIYGEGHVPYADDPQGGRLGVYLMRSHSKAAVLKLTIDMMRGAWKGNRDLSVVAADVVHITHRGRKSRDRAVTDGELVELDRQSNVRIHKRGLRVLVPEDAGLS